MNNTADSTVPNRHRERERKYDVPADFAVPDPGAVVPGSWVERVVVRLESTYYDTADHRLLRQHITLRRREGDTDTGWQLKLPAGPARTELTQPLGEASTPPESLAALVRGVAAGAELEPIAVVRTTRRATRTYNGRGLVAEIADDEVHATATGTAVTVSQWRELEIELGDGGTEKVLARLERAVLRAGAHPATWPSKLARAVDFREPELDPATGAGLVSAYLRQQVAALVAGDVALRSGDDRVHKTRVATRRFRSVLRVYAGAFHEEEVHALDGELSWYQDLLGQVRDRQVQRAHFAEQLAALPDELVLGPVAAHIDQTLLQEELHHLQQLRAALDDERYFALVAAATAFATVPPLVDELSAVALVRPARKAYRKTRDRLRAALATDDAALLHRARKSAKRARYAAELTQPVEGKRAKRVVRWAKQVQDALGEHQDATVAAALLRRLGAAAGTTPGENGFTFGLLFAREQQRAAAARDRAQSL